MGLKDTIAGALNAGFAALDDLKKTVTYKTQGVGIYVPSTGTFTRVETDLSTLGIFMDYHAREIDGAQIKPHDMKFLLQQNKLSVAPKENDRLLCTDGKYWEVISIKKDPADATWELQLRSTNG